MMSGESDILFLILTHMEEDGYTFWAQRHSPTIKLDLEHIRNRLEKISAGEVPKVNNLVEGRVYGCKFVDDCWYRCRVLFTISKGKCLVQYIDYGNFEEKNQTSLVDIPIDLQESSMPPMALRYRLHNLHIDPDNIDKARKYIEAKCSDDFVKAKLLSTDASSEVSFMNVILFDEEGVSIGEQLIKSGLGINAALYKARKSVKISSPVVSQAQKFRNPLLSSSDEGIASDEVNNNDEIRSLGRSRKNFTSSQSSGLDSMREVESKGGPDGFCQGKKKIVIECENCAGNKENAETMRLSMIKLRHDLSDSERRVMSLIERQVFWKNKYMELKQEQIRADSAVPVMEQPNKREKEKPVQMTKMKDEKHAQNFPVLSPRKDIVAKNEIDENFAKSSAIMNKVILPTFDFTKKLMSSNKIIDNYLKYDQDLKDIVGKIKSYLEKGGNQIADEFLGLISRRNSVLQYLLQPVQFNLPSANTVDDIALKDKVEEFLTQLKKIILESDAINRNVDDTQVSITDVCESIQKWKTDKANSADLSGIVIKLMTCLLQQSEKYNRSKELSAQAKATQADISSYQSQGKIIKEASDEIKSIRRKRQKIRLLVAELMNLEEEEKHADASESESLKLQKEKILKDLCTQRKDLHECFDNKWILLESLADMVEKFSPELQNEHPELGIGDYIKGKGIMLKDMELDHFTVTRVEMNKNLNIEVLHTDYKGEPIVLHKYPLNDVSEKSWDAVLEYIAIYTNVESPNVVVPFGIFKEKDTVYVMLTTPRSETCPISEIVNLDQNDILKILKDVAAALNALHENGITHGQLSINSVSASAQPVLGYLSVPNFFQESGNTSLAEDIRQFGLLAKSLIRDAPHPKLQVAIEKCLKNSSTITMQPILEAF